MMHFLAGAMFGGLVGVVTMCLCMAAGESDRQMGPK
ncbi:MAG: DUF3789 domain-containing protein [Ruminococcus sp.]|nr:DUF3789 domain-containing protein [Ruminococcus sp.]MBR2305250.1 DUF3789 domain-containing protein [Ruminococcus sp.]